MSKRDVNFEPSAETKELYLATRKDRDFNYGGFFHPGLFSTYNYSRDVGLVILAIVLEIAGLFLLLVFAELDVIVAVGLSIGILFVDLLFAWWHHKPQTTLQRAMIEMRLADSKSEKDLNEKIVKSSISKKRLLALPIILMSIIKIFFFVEAYLEIDGLFIVIVGTYVLVAVIHIYATGYFLAEWLRRANEKSEYSKYIKEDSQRKKDRDIENGQRIPYDAGDHFLEFESAAKLNTYVSTNSKLELLPSGKYKFWSSGVLSDAELQTFIGKQNNDEKEFSVSKNGLTFQYKRILQYQTLRK